MSDELKELLEFLNSVKKSEYDSKLIEKIYNIIGFLNAMDIKNGLPYLYELKKDNNIEKHLKYRQLEKDIDKFGKPITVDISFTKDCYAMIVAISKVLLEDKVKAEYKNKMRPDIKRLTDIVDFYKTIIEIQRR